jgi:hypothetical protein
MLRYCWKRKKAKCCKRFETKFVCFTGWPKNSWHICKNNKKNYATLFQFPGSIEHFVEMPLDGIKSLLQDRERSSSLKWRIKVASWLRREPKFLFCLPKWRGLRTCKEDFGPFFELLHEQETQHFAYSQRLKRKGVWKKRSVRALQMCGPLQPRKMLCVSNQRSPSKSTRKVARACEMRGRSVQSILRMDFKMLPYKITVMH